jgi:tRNA U34 5-carboxymethylaminomethyl modifying GTPase MnmE/TrmE
MTLFFFSFFPLRCDGRDMDFASLTKAHHALCIIIDNAQKEAEQAKNLANNAFAGTCRSPYFYSYTDREHKSQSAMEPLIDSDATLKRAADTKAVLKELQEDLAACMEFSCFLFFNVHEFFQAQRVTDLLRDKLYNQSTLLVEARDRIHELEEEKRISLGELLQGRKEVTHNAELLADVGESLCICP